MSDFAKHDMRENKMHNSGFLNLEPQAGKSFWFLGS